MEQAPSDERRAVEEIIEEIREMPTFGPASDHDACQYWANIARELANAIEREQVGRGHVPRFGIRLANGYVNDNHGKGWTTSKAAEDQLSAWYFGGDNFGSAMSHQFSGAVVIEIGTAPAEAVR